MSKSSKKKLFADLLEDNTSTVAITNKNSSKSDNASANHSNTISKNASINVRDNDNDIIIKNSSNHSIEIESSSENDLGNASNSKVDLVKKSDIENVTELDTLSKINNYRKMVTENENKKAFNDLFEQQNVYIDKNIVKAVDKLLKTKGKKKKDVYNEALKLYLDVMYDQKVKLKSEENN